MKAAITNNSKANQGVYTDEGLKFIEPGQTLTLTLAKDYVERAKSLPFLTVEEGGAAKAEKPAKGRATRAKAEKPADDARTDDELRAAVIDRLGEEGAADLDRQAMIELLSGEE